jgi:nitrogen fixation NifU-like protein
MTEAIIGKRLTEVQKLFAKFHTMLTESSPSHDLGKLMILSGVREFPVRVKCATLAWHTMRAALENRQQPVSTED